MAERTQINPEFVTGSATEINLQQVVRSNATQINQQIGRHGLGKATQINREFMDMGTAMTADMTQMNRTAQDNAVSVPIGTELAGGYIVEEPFLIQTGEANLYRCIKAGTTYIAKFYRCMSAIKPKVADALKGLRSEHVARLYETNEWQGMPYEIIQYYQYGSLRGKTYNLEELFNNIIPSLNEGLKALHEMDIIHKDLKPANVMLCDDKKSVAIIDFGISSIREGGNTVVVTRAGMTPEYSAPETFRNVFLVESDYYSLGVTIYELFCGHTPYIGSNRDAIEKYVAVQKISFPDNFPEPLKELVEGLTYNDITNRKDKQNPNRRWTYEEVDKWCHGEKVIVPGVEKILHSADKIIPSITFQYKHYNTIGSLVDALGQDWTNGRKRLYRSYLSDKFAVFNTDYASICRDAEKIIKQNNSANQDVEFFRVLYRLCPDTPAFHWKNTHYKNMCELGRCWLKALREKNISDLTNFVDMMLMGLFSLREGIVASDHPERGRQIKEIEGKYQLAVAQKNVLVQTQQMYVMAYLYAKTGELITSFGSFYSLDELSEYVQKEMLKGDQFLEQIAAELVSDDHSSDFFCIKSQDATPEFYGWLFAQGKGSIFQG